jgi:uncharacterized damage-inducible protein DinB
MVSNIDFFKGCLSNEFNATLQLISSLPKDKLNYKPHPVNRSAYEIVEHLLAHTIDLKVILENSACEETMTCSFDSIEQACTLLTDYWKAAEASIAKLDDTSWETEPVELFVNGQSFVTLPRFQMMWFFFFDMIHHRGQLSSYVRPMGGKNPAVYGYSADTI